jgi:hypothetical protein
MRDSGDLASLEPPAARIMQACSDRLQIRLRGHLLIFANTPKCKGSSNLFFLLSRLGK